MSRATLTFKLPEENDEFEMAHKGAIYKYCLKEVSDFLRKKLKYESDTLSQDAQKAFAEMREELCAILNESGVDLS